jgi:TolA-binding protein
MFFHCERLESGMNAIKQIFTFRSAGSLMVLAVMWFAASEASAAGQVVVQDQKMVADSSTGPAASAGPGVATSNRANSNAEILKELEQMRARIAELEAQLKSQQAGAPAVVSATITAVQPASAESRSLAMPAPQGSTEQQARPAQKPEPSAPFVYADWTWLNGTARNKDTVWDSKFFTPEIRFDANYISSFNHPRDGSLGGSTEAFRSNEFQIEQISFGGDLHWENVRARILTMGGLFGVTTPRNDASPGRGQWDLRGAYKYFSEASGGYHFNVNHGLNFDAGIFVSYIGLFSYYNFDNWAYQPSYVSSNTPWFFNGVRIQWFPTDKLKIEPWIINGWQSYARLGSKPGLGGQIVWRPKAWLSLVFNNYGMGEDTLGNGNGQFGRSRIHTDDSVEVKYYDRPEKLLDKMAFSFTGDLGCEYGGKGTGIGAQGQTIILNTNCFHDTPTSRKQTFAGWMLYNRFWFKKDMYGLTVGGGAMDNPGRYLTLLPPINGADAISGSPYFTQNPGDPFKAWDTSLTFDWMPREYITFRSEYGYRHANVPYWSGRGGITPGANGFPSVVPNPNAGSIVPGTLFVPGPSLSPTPGFTCVAATGFCPDLRNDEAALRFAVMVKF